jgi:hypothetical protein
MATSKYYATEKPYTAKQMGDACEMLVAAELTLGGIPSLKVPDNWPSYDILAQPRDSETPLRISVKSRTFKKGGDDFVIYRETDAFDWLAVVILRCPNCPRRIFIIPREVADARARKNKPTSKTADERYWPIDQTERLFPEFEDNFCLAPLGRQAG